MHQTLDDLLARALGTWEEVAEDCQLSARALYNLRHGKVKRPRRATVAALAQALRVPPRIVLAAIMATAVQHGN